MKIEFTTDAAKKYFENAVQTIREASDDDRDEGSRTFEALRAQGMVVGMSAYAPTEPHHIRGPGGSWTYEQMYNPVVEAALETLYEGPPGIVLHDVWLVLRRNSDGSGRWVRRFESNGVVEDMNLDGLYISTCAIDVWPSAEDDVEYFSDTISNDESQGEPVLPISSDEIARWWKDWAGAR